MSDNVLRVAEEIRQYVAGGRVVERLIRVTRPDGTTVDIPTHGMTHHEAIGFAIEYVQRHDSKETR